MTAGGGFAYRLATPAGQGAIAVIDITGDVEAGLAALGAAPPPPVGRVALRDLAGVDRGLVARWSDNYVAVTPHAGPYVVAQLLEALQCAGGARAGACDPALWPEAADLAEARMLAALARGASPVVVEHLLDQPRRWRAWDGVTPDVAEITRMSALLDRLIEPPLVVALGATNIGKSTLVNALAAAEVSIVADEAGVTRDHVGVLLTLDGLTVRWVDTPGVRLGAPEAEREAMAIARSLVSSADLLILCADASTSFLEADDLAHLGAGEGCQTLRVGLRADQGGAEGAEVQTSAGGDGRGLETLTRVVRQRLVPDEALAWEGPWTMGGGEPSSLQGGGGSPTLACSDR